jgi:hypothetical protein
VAEPLAKPSYSWRFLTAAPPREVFAVMEQMLGLPPFRYEVTSTDSARIVEFERKGFFGQWRKLERRLRDGSREWKRRVRPRWVTVRSTITDTGTLVEVAASRGRGPVPRALQLVNLLTRGTRDRRTIYRERRIPPGPVTLVASWAGTPYPLYEAPDFSAPRGAKVLTATPLVAISEHGPFIRVRLPDGTEGYVERDEIVPAPFEATRRAQEETAVLG